MLNINFDNMGKCNLPLEDNSYVFYLNFCKLVTIYVM